MTSWMTSKSKSVFTPPCRFLCHRSGAWYRGVIQGGIEMDYGSNEGQGVRQVVDDSNETKCVRILNNHLRKAMASGVEKPGVNPLASGAKCFEESSPLYRHYFCRSGQKR